jgi:hypothetical protein
LTVTYTEASVKKTTTFKVTVEVTKGPIGAYIPRYRQIIVAPDMQGDGRGEVLGVETKTGNVNLYQSLGQKIAAPVQLAFGLNDHTVYATEDWSGNGQTDLLSRDAAGLLYLYEGDGKGKITKVTGSGVNGSIGKGWQTYTIIPAGDMNGDKKADLLAIDADGLLWLYPANGKGGFKDRYQVGKGWKGFTLYAAGDLTTDGKADILSIDSTGILYMYRGIGDGTFKAREQVGKGWLGYTLASGGDLTGDKINDIVGRNDKDGVLYMYESKGSGMFKDKVQFDTGW